MENKHGLLNQQRRKSSETWIHKTRQDGFVRDTKTRVVRLTVEAGEMGSHPEVDPYVY